MSKGVEENQGGSARLLIIIGSLWLLLAAALLVYQFATPPKVEIAWETATELETAGFYLYRATSPEGEFVALNPSELIAGRGSAVSGASYTYIDSEVEAGQTYYYLLEEVEFDATTNRYRDDIFSYKVPGMVWWAVILTAVSVLIGFALLVAGLKESKS